ncbi:hypothetical protein IRP63_01240 [Clostridium botulinum]|uniref:Uncharacterized protein n=1 Tax=Clostridium botulinum C/D str. DC5 TaxID=1443128 RepID=A0A0A0IDD3_CLOBO|nr:MULTISPECIES: hypothetical protein [Clostridium]KEI11049.1 hypothetical protein Z957_10250 [Clostridium sp. K25]KGM99459.1 hypothetical protein Z955_07825 [Clostridium botulinum C/D str. DC5]KOC47809.1 hypothetical protein ADU88_09340 [Clostridium botulinum]KOC56277.1 hypothetical protein ADU90_08625 [Clostridium botulinum]KOC57283.1 hypothetical protein ADU89_00200 [Clostridium botulinum]
MLFTDKVLIIINLILSILFMIAAIKSIKKDIKSIKHKNLDNEPKSKEKIIQSIKENWDTHGIAIMYACSIIALLLNSGKHLNRTLFCEGMYIAGGVQALFFIIKNNITKNTFLLRIICVISISYITSFMI